MACVPSYSVSRINPCPGCNPTITVTDFVSDDGCAFDYDVGGSGPCPGSTGTVNLFGCPSSENVDIPCGSGGGVAVRIKFMCNPEPA